MKIRNLLGILGFLLISCAEEEDKMLRTDTPTEAQQLFSISKLQNEHLFLGLKTWQELSSVDGSSLPGCPEIVLETESKKVTLNYSPLDSCESNMARTGTIILDLALQESSSREWFMEFQNYSYGGDTIKGLKVFKRLSNQIVSQTFENLKITSSENAGFLINGDISHTIPPSIGPAINLVSTSGQIEGRNPIGRNILMTITESTVSIASCSLVSSDLPSAGIEAWQVGRGNGNSVTHILSYETADICQTTAKMQLPDGRILVLNP